VAVRTQHFLQHLAPPGGIGRQQHPALERPQERVQRGEGLLGTYVDAQLARRAGGKIPHRGGLGLQLGVGLEGIEGDGLEGPQGCLELRGLEKQLHRLEHRTLDIVAALLVAGADVLPGLEKGSGERRVVDDHRIRGQVVEQRRGRIEEQRLIELHARRRQPLAHRAVDGALVRISLEARAVAAAKILYRLSVERHLTRRQEPHALECIKRALRLGVEAANGLDLVVEQVDAQRRGGAHGIHVEE
jgi:hypothetical protein